MPRLLGRRPSRLDARSLRFGAYLNGWLPAAPPARDWSHPEHAPSWGMWRNDSLSDCTCAAMAHMLQAQAANAGHPAPLLTDGAVVALYDAINGGSDQGAMMIDALKQMRGAGLAGVRIGGFAVVDWRNRLEVEAVVNLTGSLYVGVDLPIAVQQQTVWDVGQGASFEPGSWGGHAVIMLGYDRSHVTFVTWGQVKIATVEWFRTYTSEAWAIFDDLWLRDDGLTPSGFDAAALRRDVAALA